MVVELPPFQDPNIARVHAQIVAWADAQGWTRGDLRRRGSRLEQTWAHGTPGKAEIPAPGTTRAALSVFAHSDPTASYGLQWTAGRRDVQGRGLQLRVVTGGSPVTPDQVHLELQRGDEASVSVGAPIGWKVGERVVETARPAGLNAVDARLATYGAWSDAASSDLDGLEAAVRTVLDAADYTVCDYGPSPGNGIPGPCVPRSPTDAERSAHRSAFDAEITRRRAVIADPAWPALLAAVTPPI